MKLDLDNKVAIVTGASTGLGKAIALSLSKEGAKVAISGRHQGTVDHTAQEIESNTGTHVLAFTGDMTQVESVQCFVDKVIDKFGTIHILVNNVGQANRGMMVSLDQTTWQQAFEVNVMSAVHISKEVIPYMQEQRWGRIINIAALSAKEPGDELIASNVAKSGLVSFSKTLSRELAPDNILVNCVSPGLIESPQNDRYFTDDERREALDKIPLGRFGRSEEFADLVTFLCSERASYITGINLLVDGGASRGL
ncbi:MAG: SDR family oxidoreductase [Chloroflexota bacterium]